MAVAGAPQLPLSHMPVVTLATRVVLDDDPDDADAADDVVSDSADASAGDIISLRVAASFATSSI